MKWIKTKEKDFLKLDGVLRLLTEYKGREYAKPYTFVLSYIDNFTTSFSFCTKDEMDNIIIKIHNFLNNDDLNVLELNIEIDQV
jgi:hypothetical protein